MGTARHRSNASVRSFETTSALYDSSGNQKSANLQVKNLYDYADCTDELNEMALMGKTPFDIGGSLLSLSVKNDYSPCSTYAAGSAFGLKWTVEGPLIAYPTYAVTGADLNGTWKSTALSGLDSTPYRIGLGATAISRCKPATPEAQLSTALAETLREGIPSTLLAFRNIKDEVAKFRDLSKARKAREVPSKYLEHQFGWLPLVADIRSTAHALLNHNAILDDLRRNSGMRMRRRYAFPDLVTTTQVASDSTRPWPSPNAYVMGQTGKRVITLTTTKKTWFAGEFIYTYPSVDAAIPLQWVRGARSLLGADLTPETVWNIAPWSWLADWFANVGDVVSNFTAIGADHLVLRYGYLMQEATKEYRHSHSGLSIREGFITPTCVGTTRYTAKSRIGASPFGFGLTFDSLSPRQIAILASIGVTRRGRH